MRPRSHRARQVSMTRLLTRVAILASLLPPVSARGDDCLFAKSALLLGAIDTHCSTTHRLTLLGKEALARADSARSSEACINEAIMTLAQMRFDSNAVFCARLEQKLPGLIER